MTEMLITVGAVLVGVLVVIPLIVSSFLRNVDAGTIRMVSWLQGSTVIYRGPGKSKEVPLLTTGTTLPPSDQRDLAHGSDRRPRCNGDSADNKGCAFSPARSFRWRHGHDDQDGGNRSSQGAPAIRRTSIDLLSSSDRRASTCSPTISSFGHDAHSCTGGRQRASRGRHHPGTALRRRDQSLELTRRRKARFRNEDATIRRGDHPQPCSARDDRLGSPSNPQSVCVGGVRIKAQAVRPQNLG